MKNLILYFLIIFLAFKVDAVVGQNFTIEPVLDDLKTPWSIGFLPEGELLITEREGNLIRYDGSQKIQIKGLPSIFVKGQGGLLDVLVHPDFEENQTIFISYSAAIQSGKSATAIARAKLQDDQLQELKVLFTANLVSGSRLHFGSRMVYDNGYLYFSAGERGDWDNSQKLSNDAGKVHRIHEDGRIPSDNPFVDREGVQPSIYSYGHRNPQGAVINPFTKQIWTHEHGPKGGDEINIIRPGVNYGWPAITFGINYNGKIISPDTAKIGMAQPHWYWVPSIAPSGMAFVTHPRYGRLQGDLLVGSLKFGYLHRCHISNGKVIRDERLIDGLSRVRDVKESPDGWIYLALENPGRIVKVLPAN